AFTQTILVTILNISTAGIDHEDTLPVGSPLFVDYQHACRNTGSVEKVCRKTYDALDPVFLDNRLSDRLLCVSPEKDSVRKDDCRVTVVFQCFQNMHQPGIIAILLRRRIAISLKASIFFPRNTITPVLHGKWWIGHYVVKA